MRYVRPANAKTLFSYRDELAQKRRQVLFRKLSIASLIVLVSAVGTVYVLFFSPVLQVQTVAVTGTNALPEDELRAYAGALLDKPWLKFIRPRRNTFFLSADTFRSQLMAQFPILREVAVEKDYPHEVRVRVSERTAAGIWCFHQECVYFDQDGSPWGQAPVSAGFVLLNVSDLRAVGEKVVDRDFLAAIRQITGGLSGMKLKTKVVTIPEGSIDEFRVTVAAGYDVLFSIDSDLPGQLGVLKIFLDQRSASPAFNPQYLDLRIDGRVYYKPLPTPSPVPSGVPA